jgi:hypothetical protein
VTSFYGADNDAAVGAAILQHAVNFVPIVVLGLWFIAHDGLSLGRLRHESAAARTDAPPSYGGTESAAARTDAPASYGGTGSAAARTDAPASYGGTGSAAARTDAPASYGGTESAAARTDAPANYGGTRSAAAAGLHTTASRRSADHRAEKVIL